MKIKKIDVFDNGIKASIKLKAVLIKKLEENGFVIDNKKPDMVIAVGGDGCFLSMLKYYNFSSDIVYVGVNTGNLGFLQEIKKDDIDGFIETLKTGDYKVEAVGIQESHIKTKTDTHLFYSLNEVVIRNVTLNIICLDINTGGSHLENFRGDGILVSTSVGSTAYNLALGGAIVYNMLHTLQITPMAPLNSKVYQSLTNSVIVPQAMPVEIIPTNTNHLLISIDGTTYEHEDVISIETVVKDKRINCLRLESYNFFEKINDKLLKE